MMLEEALKIIDRPSQNTVNLLINELKQNIWIDVYNKGGKQTNKQS